MADVTDADRDAALDGYHSFFENVPNEAWENAMLAGKHDDDEVVQAFAAHRIAAEQACADKIARLQRERDQAVEALRWYAEQGANCRKFTNEGGLARANLDRDGGERARATLASIEGAEDAG